MRLAARTDTNHAEVREGLRALGFYVIDTHQLTHGFPDLVVVAPGRVVLLEVKRQGEQLTPDEQTFFERADGAPCFVVHSLEEAAEAIENSL